MTSFYIPFGVTILSMASYHVAQKLLSSCQSPFLVLTVAYAVAAILCLGAAVAVGTAQGVAGSTDGLGSQVLQLFHWKNWPVLLLALALVGIEVGILFTYRHGAAMGTLPLLLNAGLLVISLPVSVMIFREQVSMGTLAGVALVLAGFWLMTRH